MGRSRFSCRPVSRVDLVDPRSGIILTPIYPLDRRANADGQRLLFELDSEGEQADHAAADQAPTDNAPAGDSEKADKQKRGNPLPPLLQKILDEYSATGTPPAYLPKKPRPKKGDPS
jgi:hypothetical protein